MKIVELTAYHVRIPLRKPIRHASHRRTDTENVLVRCVLADHTEGFGEGGLRLPERDKDVCIASANIAQQALDLGLVDRG